MIGQKKLLVGLVFVVILISGCLQPQTPGEVAEKYIKSIANCDLSVLNFFTEELRDKDLSFFQELCALESSKITISDFKVVGEDIENNTATVKVYYCTTFPDCRTPLDCNFTPGAKGRIVCGNNTIHMINTTGDWRMTSGPIVLLG